MNPKLVRSLFILNTIAFTVSIWIYLVGQEVIVECKNVEVENARLACIHITNSRVLIIIGFSFVSATLPTIIYYRSPDKEESLNMTRGSTNE